MRFTFTSVDSKKDTKVAGYRDSEHAQVLREESGRLQVPLSYPQRAQMKASSDQKRSEFQMIFFARIREQITNARDGPCSK